MVLVSASYLRRLALAVVEDRHGRVARVGAGEGGFHGDGAYEPEYESFPFTATKCVASVKRSPMSPFLNIPGGGSSIHNKSPKVVAIPSSSMV